MNQNEKASAMLYDGEEQKTEKNSAEGKNGERIRETYVETLFIDERHEAILTMLAEKGRITAAEIQENFGVSFDTARRDLRLLEERGRLKRTHGGALPIQQVGARKPAGMTCRDISEVRKNYLEIAKKAVSMIRPNDVVYITPATVGYFMTQNLPAGMTFTAVTNSILIADELRKYPDVKVIMAGGEMDAKGNCYDSFSKGIISRLRFDKCFVTSACISAEFGLSIQKSSAVDYVNTVLDSSRCRIGLYPTEKLGQESVLSICPANRLNMLITDWEAGEDELEKYERLGLEVVVVNNDD